MNARLALLILTFTAAFASGERLKAKTFTPKLAHREYNTEVKASASSSSDPKTAALAFVNDHYKLQSTDYVVKSAYTTQHSGITHVYLKQLYKGDEVFNGDLNVNVDKSGKILSVGNSFAPSAVLSTGKVWGTSSTGFVKPLDALQTLSKHLNLPAASNAQEKASNLDNGRPRFIITGLPYTKNDVTVEQAYIQTGDGKLQPVWDVNLHLQNNWYHATVSADGKSVLSLVDWVADASYRVVQLGDDDMDDTPRQLLTDPYKAASSSPNGWHDQGTAQFTTTIGNNVYAQENWEGADNYLNNQRPEGGAALSFDFPIDLAQGPQSYINASVTNLFYWNNIMHDVFYQYGFDEVSGNFQMNNFGKGGVGNDAVIANAQDGSGTDNANFETPPDGQNGRMRMYVFDNTTPNRDGDLESGIMSHEYTHGISTRLTGGPANSDCLGAGEAGGMGEGWSDFFAVSLQMKATDTRARDTPVGAWVNQGATIRHYVYSTNMTTNPTTYSLLNNGWTEVHDIGEIWCNTLYEMFWNLVEATGKFNPDYYSADKTAGNTLALQYVTDGFKLQPCNPTFVSARDAILQAEQQVTNGKYKCELWKAFAKRGVGAKAASDGSGTVTEDFTLPSDCGATNNAPATPTLPAKVAPTPVAKAPTAAAKAPAAAAKAPAAAKVTPSKFNPVQN